MVPRIKRQKGTLLAILLFSLLIFNETACTKLIPEVAPTPVDLKTPAEEKALLDKIRTKASERVKYFKNLKALAETTIQFPGKRAKRKNILLLRKDSSIRIEGLSISGRPLMYFISNRESSSIYYPDRKVIYKGAYSPKNIASIIGINMELEKIISILSGNLNIPAEPQRLVLKEGKEYYLMKYLQKNNKMKKVFLDKESYLPVELIEKNLTKRETIRVQYKNYKKVNSYLLPFNIKIEVPEKKVTIFIRYISVFINKGIPDSSFKLPMIKGVKILPFSNN